jgi:signal transduction histidine kinase
MAATTPPADPMRAVRRTDGLLALALAVVLLPITVIALLGGEGIDGWGILAIALFAALHATVAIRRRYLRWALALGALLMLGITAASLPDASTFAALLPSSAAFLVLVYTAAAEEDPLAAVAAPLIGVLGAGMIVGVAMLRLEANDVISFAATSGFLIASIGAAWALGRYRRESLRKRAAQDVARAQAVELQLQQERQRAAEERRRIGRDLHDVIAHSLAVMVAQAEAARVQLDHSDAEARTAVEQVVATGRSAMSDMRGLLGAFDADPGSDAAGTEEGRAASRVPSPGLESIPDLVAAVSAPDREVVLRHEGTPWVATPALALTVYRVVQEALTNTMRHAAPPTKSVVSLTWTPTAVTVTVDDNGVGGVVREGRGIRGMRHRVEQLGGTLTAGPSDSGPSDSGPSDAGPRDTGSSGAGPTDTGWRVVATLPRPETA